MSVTHRVSWKSVPAVCVCVTVTYSMVLGLSPGWKPLNALPPPPMGAGGPGSRASLLPAPDTPRAGARPAEWRRTCLCSGPICLRCSESTATGLGHSGAVTQRPPASPRPFGAAAVSSCRVRVTAHSTASLPAGLRLSLPICPASPCLVPSSLCWGPS